MRALPGFLRKPFSQKQVIDELRLVCATRRQVTRGSNSAGAPKSPATGRGAVKPASIGGTQRPTVVIADDNSSIRLLLKGVLSDLGLNIVGQAANGEEAIRAVMTHKPALLFLDVNMPILSGLEALPRIVEASPETAVVMVTGDTSRTIVQQAAGLGARGYIVKPVRPSYVEKFLKETVQKLICCVDLGRVFAPASDRGVAGNPYHGISMAACFWLSFAASSRSLFRMCWYSHSLR